MLCWAIFNNHVMYQSLNKCLVDKIFHQTNQFVQEKSSQNKTQLLTKIYKFNHTFISSIPVIHNNKTKLLSFVIKIQKNQVLVQNIREIPICNLVITDISSTKSSQIR